MIGRFMLLALASMILAACATVPPPSMDVGDFQQFRIVGVVVEGTEVIRSWPTQEEVYFKTHAVDANFVKRLQTEPSSNFPELREPFRTALEERFGAEFNAKVAPLFTGSRPLKAIIRLKVFDVPSAARRVFIESQAKIKAEIDLVDAKSGASILKYDGPLRLREIGGGLATGLIAAISSNPGDLLIAAYVSEYRNWLLRN